MNLELRGDTGTREIKWGASRRHLKLLDRDYMGKELRRR